MNLDTFLICVSHNNYLKGLNVIKQFLNSDNKKHGILLFVENANYDNYVRYSKKYSSKASINFYYIDTPNKARCINFLVKEKIELEEALIICTDNDIKIPNGFINRYKEIAEQKKTKYFYGGGMQVKDYYNDYVNENYLKLYQQSQFSKKDSDFIKIKDLIFLGCNYAFFKSQWKYVKGFDERFAPGSEYNLAAEESIFQKKLKFVGFKPFFVNNNEVIHYPEKESYKLSNLKRRTTQNGLTHGFSKIINSKSFLKLDYMFFVLGMLKSIIEFKLKGLDKDYIHKKYYTIGYLKAFILFIKIENKKSIYHKLNRLND